MKVLIVLFLSIHLLGCISCQPTTYLKKIPINVPKEVQVVKAPKESNTYLDLKVENLKKISVVIRWWPGEKYASWNLVITVLHLPKNTHLSFVSNQLTELDTISGVQTNTHFISEFIHKPHRKWDRHEVTIETESYIDLPSQIFKFPELVINGNTYRLPDIRTEKVTEELCRIVELM